MAFISEQHVIHSFIQAARRILVITQQIKSSQGPIT